MEVSIRPYQNDDANALYAAAKESAVELQPFMPWCHPDYRIDESRSWIEMQVTGSKLVRNINLLFLVETNFSAAVV
jgi:hypothetical protein